MEEKDNSLRNTNFCGSRKLLEARKHEMNEEQEMKAIASLSPM